MISLTSTTFKSLITNSPIPVLVEFTSPTCVACKALLPSLHAMAAKYSGRVTFATIDAEAHPSIARQFGVRSLPTCLTFKSGKLHSQLIGACSIQALEQSIIAAIS